MTQLTTEVAYLYIILTFLTMRILFYSLPSDATTGREIDDGSRNMLLNMDIWARNSISFFHEYCSAAFLCDVSGTEMNVFYTRTCLPARCAMHVRLAVAPRLPIRLSLSEMGRVQRGLL